MVITVQKGAAAQLSDARATRTVLLPESTLLNDWREWVNNGQSGRPPLDWFLALAELSNPAADLRSDEPVVMRSLGPALGLPSSKPVSNGAITRRFNDLVRALGDPAMDGAPTDAAPILRLYHQARMATFLPYRDGLIRYLREVPITPESAVHAYVRLVTEWAMQWRGLAVATRSEYDLALKRAGAQPRIREQERRLTMAARSGLPLIINWDLRSLLQLFQEDAANVGSSDPQDWQISIALDAITAQLSYAVAAMAEDPSLGALSAANLARAEANAGLGGALGRMRVRAEHEGIVALHVLEEVRRYFLDPIADDSTAQDVEQRALMAKKFHLLRIAVEAMSAPSQESKR
jgi:hypothetical protein